jgi:hypothetical protein
MSSVENQALSRVSSVCLKMATPKNLVIIFLSKLSFDKLSWVFAICLRIFFGFLSKVVF